MPVIDAHVHLYPAEINADPAGWARRAGEPHWATLCTRVRRSGRPVQGFPNVEELFRSMDEAGVDQSLLLGWYWQNPESCRRQNRFFAQCARSHPDRLLFFGTVSPAWTEAELGAELRQLRDEGCLGLGELSPHTQGHGEAWAAIFGTAAAWHWPINLHVTDPAGRAYPGRQETPRDDFLRWALMYPECHYILAHWAGGAAGLASVRGLPNVWVDTAASPLLYTPAEEAGFLAGFPAERVLWGTDHPLDLYSQDGPGGGVGRCRRDLASVPGAVPALFGGNLLRLLGRAR